MDAAIAVFFGRHLAQGGFEPLLWTLAKPVVGLGSAGRVLGGNLMGIQLNRLTMSERGRPQEFLLPLIFRDRPEANAVSF